MAWNGSGGIMHPHTAEATRCQRCPMADGSKAVFCGRRRVWATVTLSILGALGLLIGWVFAPGGGPSAARPLPTAVSSNAQSSVFLPQRTRLDPTTSAATTAAPRESVQPRTYRDAHGILRYEGGARVPGQRPLAKPIELGSHQPKVFRHAAEEHISWLLDMRVGEPVIGDYAYGDAFRRSFRESLAEPVEILGTDDARTRELKSAVQETKEELCRRMEAGEDVAKIMNDTMDAFRRLARYRQELQAQLHEIRADGERYSEQDVEDFTRAANRMMEHEGLPPIAMPRTLMRGLRQR